MTTLDGAAVRGAWIPLARLRWRLAWLRWALALWPVLPVVTGAVWALWGPWWVRVLVLVVAGVVVAVAAVVAVLRWPWLAALLRARWIAVTWPWLAGGSAIGVRVRIGRRERVVTPFLWRCAPWWTDTVAGVDLVVRLLPGQRLDDLRRFADDLGHRLNAEVEVIRSGRVLVVRIVEVVRADAAYVA